MAQVRCREARGATRREAPRGASTLALCARVRGLEPRARAPAKQLAVRRCCCARTSRATACLIRLHRRWAWLAGSFFLYSIDISQYYMGSSQGGLKPYPLEPLVAREPRDAQTRGARRGRGRPKTWAGGCNFCTNDSKSEKVYHFHVESGILEYVLMPPRESSDAAGEREP